MKKILMLGVLGMIGILSLVGCNNTDNNTPQETNQAQGNVGTEGNAGTEGNTDTGDSQDSVENQGELQNLFTEIVADVELPVQMVMPEEIFVDAYGIDEDILVDKYISMSQMNVHASEIALFEVQNEEDVVAVKKGLERREAALEEQWQSYLPEQYEIVKDYRIAVKGNKILFVISDNADEIVEAFNRLA